MTDADVAGQARRGPVADTRRSFSPMLLPVEGSVSRVGLALERVAGVAGVPLQRVVAGAGEDEVAALVAVDDVVAVAARGRCRRRYRRRIVSSPRRRRRSAGPARRGCRVARQRVGPVAKRHLGGGQPGGAGRWRPRRRRMHPAGPVTVDRALPAPGSAKTMSVPEAGDLRLVGLPALGREARGSLTSRDRRSRRRRRPGGRRALTSATPNPGASSLRSPFPAVIRTPTIQSAPAAPSQGESRDACHAGATCSGR